MEELMSFENQATRQRTKNCLQMEITRLNAQISKLENEIKSPADEGATAQPTYASASYRVTKNLTNYGKFLLVFHRV